MERLIVGQCNSHTTIRMIYDVYGHNDTSHILKAIARHEVLGDHVLMSDHS